MLPLSAAPVNQTISINTRHHQQVNSQLALSQSAADQSWCAQAATEVEEKLI
jgi:hypothetical protein